MVIGFLSRRRRAKDLVSRQQVVAPTIPFRKHTDEERREFWNYASQLGPEKDMAFWESTIPRAQELVERLSRDGWVVENHVNFGELSFVDGGAHGGSHIYARNMVLTGQNFDKFGMVGNLLAWNQGGFFSEPLSVWYYPRKGGKEQVDSALTFRDYLTKEEIPFSENINVKQLRQDVLDLRNRADMTEYLVNQYEARTSS